MRLWKHLKSFYNYLLHFAIRLVEHKDTFLLPCVVMSYVLLLRADVLSGVPWDKCVYQQVGLGITLSPHTTRYPRAISVCPPVVYTLSSFLAYHRYWKHVASQTAIVKSIQLTHGISPLPRILAYSCMIHRRVFRNIYYRKLKYCLYTYLLIHGFRMHIPLSLTCTNSHRSKY